MSSSVSHFNYTTEDNDVWKTLLTQQLPLAKKVACNEYIEGLEKLNFPLNYIPSITEISTKLKKLNGWSLEPVDFLVPNRIFFEMLAQKKFPVVRVIRKKEEIDFYTNEAPDVFHEYFGHCPMLIHPLYGKCIQIFGEYAQKCDEELLVRLSKIFWATFEFGLIKNANGLKIYGAGILPSRQEIIKVMSHNINIKQLDIYSSLDSSLQGNISQPTFYYVDSLESLYDIIKFDLAHLIDEKQSVLLPSH